MSEQIPIFIINLKQDSHKKKHMEKLCKQHNLNCQFIDAIYGKDLDNETLAKVYNKKESIELIDRELTRGELGCALSHISIYKHMLDKDITQAIIFEDDIEIKEDFHSIISNINSYPKDWELILLGYFKGSVKKEKLVKSYLRDRKKITDTHKLTRLKQIGMGSHGYLINSKGARKLIKASKTIRLPIDHYTGDDQYTNLYAVFPRVIGVHNLFAIKHSSLELERNQIKNKVNLISKIKKEMLRPFHQLVKIFKLARKYK